MRRPWILFSVLTVVYGCTTSGGADRTAKTVDITHFNIIIAPDLSNRQSNELYPRPLNDEQIVKIVLRNLWPTILNYRRMDNQKDKISVSFINRNLINEYAIDAAKLAIDFEKFKSQKDRIDYIKSKSERNLSVDTALFLSEYRRLCR